jgi:hypothetical protein
VGLIQAGSTGIALSAAICTSLHPRPSSRIGECVGRPFEYGEEPEHCGRLLERGSRVSAVARVPAERGSTEDAEAPCEDQEGQLEGFGEADVLEFCGGGPSG